MFRNTGNEYTGEGCKKLTRLYRQYAGTSQMEVAMVLFDFFQAYSQGDKTPNQYEANLRGLFDQFDAASNPLSKSFQVMFMMWGINEEYVDLIISFHNGQRNFLTQNLQDHGLLQFVG